MSGLVDSRWASKNKSSVGLLFIGACRSCELLENLVKTGKISMGFGLKNSWGSCGCLSPKNLRVLRRRPYKFKHTQRSKMKNKKTTDLIKQGIRLNRKTVILILLFIAVLSPEIFIQSKVEISSREFKSRRSRTERSVIPKEELALNFAGRVGRSRLENLMSDTPKDDLDYALLNNTIKFIDSQNFDKFLKEEMSNEDRNIVARLVFRYIYFRSK
jgi:hypothetical protein